MSSGTSSGLAITSTSPTSPTTSTRSSRRSAGRDRRPAGMPTTFGRCDAAKLQLRYDMVNSARKYSTCLDLATNLSLAVTDTSIRRRRHRDLHRDGPGGGPRRLRTAPGELRLGAEGRPGASLSRGLVVDDGRHDAGVGVYSGTYQLSVTPKRHVRVARLLPEARRRRPPDGLVRADHGHGVGLPDAAMPPVPGPANEAGGRDVRNARRVGGVVVMAIGLVVGRLFGARHAADAERPPPSPHPPPRRAGPSKAHRRRRRP